MKRIKNKYIDILVKMSFPILMNYLVMTLFEVLDKAIVGNYSIDDFAAVGVSATVIYGITGSLGVISAAYNIIAAQYLGTGDKESFNNSFYTVMCISLIIGLSLILLSLLGGKLLFSKVFRLDGNILNLCLEYFYIASTTIVMNMVLFNFSVYFRNLKDTKISLYSTIISTCLNVVFDYLFVYGKFGFPELGAKGAAVGSILGLIAGIAVYIIKFYRNGDIKLKGVISKKFTHKLIKLYIPLLGQDVIEGSIFPIILTGIISRLGLYEIASYNLAESLGSIMALPIYAFSTSAITLSIQKSFSNKEDNSKDNEDNPKDIINTAIVLSCFMVLIIGIFISIFPNKVLGLITKDATLILKVTKIFILVILMQVFNIFHQIYKSYLQGLNNERFVLKFTGFISTISISWILLLSIKFNLIGVYIGLCINNLIFAIVYYLKINNKQFYSAKRPSN
ncbi:MATE family efflux transporter [Clostridium sartagoforme]|uniref:Probable multidrug resistance protein NorM n=1 Tax=Clostridium sartagoforme TaxID=84031 RepID=A0A4S2DKB8_9CLOT|nr:MATE family efflux transporter [Clostridium sartagoforme]TGY42102.1 MATE family efflux transporter [Clostridium sartagoforme]